MRARLRQWLGRDEVEERMDEEIRFHLEMETERHIRAGLTPEQARRRAVLDFGGVEGHREEIRAGRRIPVLEDLWRDVRYGAASLRRSPGFSAVAALTLAVGIGASTAMFSVLDGVLLRDLPVREQDDVVVLWMESRVRASEHLPVSHADMGCLLGVLVALAGTRAPRGLLFEVRPTDPLTFGLVVAVVLLATAAACWIPARRASSVDPVVALRAE